MKKMYLVLVAVIMAVSFSAFSTSDRSKTDDEISYQDDYEVWHTFEGEPCVGDQVPEFFKMTTAGSRQLFYNRNINYPVLRYSE